MNGFGGYAAQLVALAVQASQRAVDPSLDLSVAAALNGDAAAHLRDLVDLADRRATGAFFTSSKLAEQAWSQLSATIDSDSIVLDPACGAGSLLLPAVPHLAAFSRTPDDLAKKIHGLDLSAEFTSAARARIALSSIQASSVSGRSPVLAPAMLNHIRQANLFGRSHRYYSKYSHIALNPPYVMRPAPAWFNHAGGKVNSAALMVSYCLERMHDGARMIAILPDVLKSGVRYKKWRESITTDSTIEDVSNVGQFDPQTDVHVFLLHLRKNSSSNTASTNYSRRRIDVNQHADSCVGDNFEVSVGSVVQHRNPESGSECPFVEAKGLKDLINANDLPLRRFTGRWDMPPLVLVRRTSRPGEPTRARSSIVLGDKPILVDNHLIVLRPRDAQAESCFALAEQLRTRSSTEWLDERYRCRHLTVGALKLLPISDTLGGMLK